ncbi:hypothetical protein PHMEG_00016232 [Phytophthora megakarya]|uniref:Uncharacterized protein n=1 Tax=Phytophthora megakarya TaxID=4795 RepID=A0A225VZS8_9STRA|nr:hypothetical protein PHMEG_00016232 [Phytophthora megakarya]
MRLSNAFMSESVCCVCDALHPASEVVVKNLIRSPALVGAIKSLLMAPPNLPASLQNYYN